MLRGDGRRPDEKKTKPQKNNIAPIQANKKNGILHNQSKNQNGNSQTNGNANLVNRKTSATKLENGFAKNAKLV